MLGPLRPAGTPETMNIRWGTKGTSVGTSPTVSTPVGSGKARKGMLVGVLGASAVIVGPRACRVP